MAVTAPPRHTPPTRQFLGVGIVVLGESCLTRTRATHNDNTEKNRGGYLNTLAKARRVHFVGSIPLANAAEVFRVVAEQFGDLASRIPDGETGARSHWIQFQRTAMDEAANLAKVREYALAPGISQPVYAIRERRAPVAFGALGYARHALESYRVFRALKRDGIIGPATRFQVSLPTPVAVTAGFIEQSSQARVESAYKARLVAELEEIQSQVPAHELAVQWDVAYEVLFLAGFDGSSYHDTTRSGLLERLVSLGECVRAGAELGYHLCYGDPGHKHLVEPVDLTLCVEIGNELAAKVSRSIDWIHMPVPRDRADARYFAALKDLAVRPPTVIFLGLIHISDGLEGSLRRLKAASEYLAAFGVATECGFGRRDPHTIGDLLNLHVQVARAAPSELGVEDPPIAQGAPSRTVHERFR
jgi:hypothetical protein